MTTKTPSNTKKKVGAVGGVAGLIIAAVFALEGGFVNNPKDPGGATNHGVTEKVARDHGYTGPMYDLPKELAESIYYKDYILKPNFHLVIEASPAIGEKLVDAGVNTGPSRPSRWFQIALNSLNRGGQDYPSINVDGKVGSGTVAALRSLQKIRGEVKSCELIIKLMDAQQATYYMSLTKLNTFTVGWVDHRIGNVPLKNCKSSEVYVP